MTKMQETLCLTEVAYITPPPARIQGYKDTRIFIQTPGLHVDIWIKLTYLQNGIYITILKIILKIIIEIMIMIIILVVIITIIMMLIIIKIIVI